MKCNIQQFLVLEKRYQNDRTYSATLSGMNILIPGTIVPLITKGQGCRQIAFIKECTLKVDEVTEVTFAVSEVSKEAGESYYNLYRNQVSANSGISDDPYDDAEDTIIPGLINNKKPDYRTKTQTTRPTPGKPVGW